MDSLQQRDRIERAIGGDQGALDRLLLECYEPLRAHVECQSAPEIQATVDVDDVIQKVFAQVIRDIADFEMRPDATFLGWLKAIANNRIRDAIRAQRRVKRGGNLRRVYGKGDSDSPLLNDLVNEYAATSHTPSREMARREAVQAIQVAMATLSDDHRRVVQLRYFDGLTIEETARTVGKTTGAVRGLLDRAKSRIREAMQNASCYFSDG